MTNRSDNSSVDVMGAPRLVGMRGAGETLKPDELASKVVTIVDSVAMVRKDGSTGHKWVIEHEDGTLGLYWAPGQTLPHQVAKWFRDNPGRPLTVLVRREGGEQGYPRWAIEHWDGAPAPAAGQIEPIWPDAAPGGAAGPDVADVPF